MNFYKTLSKNYAFSLSIILTLAFIAREAILVFLPAPWRPDEIFQYLEPAHKLVYGTGIVTWEWTSGIRSWLMPGFVADLMKLGQFLKIDNQVIFVRSCFAFFSLQVVAAFFWYGWRKGKSQLAWLLGLIAAFWPDFTLGSFRTLGEFQAGNLLAVSVIFIFA